MKKAMITDIKRFAVHDGDGIRTTVFFKGCPLRCVWCHNPETFLPQKQLAFFAHKCMLCGNCEKLCDVHTLKHGLHTVNRKACTHCEACVEACPTDALKVYGREMTAEDILQIVLQDRSFYDASGGGVTLSGGECLIYPDFCAELLKKCKENGIHTAVDTCGYVPSEAFDQVIPFTDVFLYDIKAMDPALHQAYTGVPNACILNNLRYIDGLGCQTEIRVPCVPGVNDTELDRITAFASTLRHAVRMRILPYHDLARSKYDALALPCMHPLMPKS